MKSLAHSVFIAVAICFFNLASISQAADPKAKHTTATVEKYPVAKPVPGMPKYVFSPYDKNGGYIDVSGYKHGAKARDPYTGKFFLVP